MSKNVVRDECNQASLPVAIGTVSGDPVAVGGYLNGVALTDRGAHTPGEATVKLNGSAAYELTGPIAVGDVISRDAVNARGCEDCDGDFAVALQALGNGETDLVEMRLLN